MFLKRRNITKKAPFFTLLLLSIFIVHETACTRLIKEASPPSESKVSVEDKILIAKILAKISERMKNFKDLRALAEITFQFPQKKIKRKNIVLLRNDPAVRFEVLSISGKPFMYFTANNLHTSIYYPESNTIFKGNSSPQNIVRIIGANIKLNNIVAILSGNLNIPSKFQRIELNESKEFYLMKFFFKNNKTKQIFVDKENYLPSKIIYNDDEGDLINIQYRDYKQVDNYFLPFVININLVGKYQEILIKYKKVQLNQGISDSSFSISVYKGMKILPLDKMK